MSWLKWLEKVFAVKVRATVFKPSRRPCSPEEVQKADAQEFLECVRDYSDQFVAVDGALFTLDYTDVFGGITHSSEFKAHLFTEAESYGLKCLAVSNYKACFKRIA